MTSKQFCTKGETSVLRQSMLALVVGATLAASIVGVSVSPASAHTPNHNPPPPTQKKDPSEPSTGTQQLLSGPVYCDVIGPNGPVCPQPGSGPVHCDVIGPNGPVCP